MLPPGSVPRFVFLDAPKHVLAMEAVADCENWKTLLMRGDVDLELVRQWGRLLGRMHRAGWERRLEMAAVFEQRAFFESLRVEAYYEYTATQVSAARAFIGTLVDEMRRRRWTLVHGDWSPKNVLVRRGRLVLLDHEVMHFGDPGFDLGFSLTHLLSKGHHLRDKREAFSDAAKAYWREYRQEMAEVPWGGQLEPLAVRHTLGCLLARVPGRSVLEYLTGRQKDRQHDAVLDLMQSPPGTVEALADGFLERV